MNNLLNELAAVEKQKQALIEQLKAFLKDTSQPLAERWETYLQIEKDLSHENWTFTPAELENRGYSNYDDFYISRYQTVDFSHFVTMIEEDPENFPDIDLDAIKEEILATGDGGFKEDW